MKKLYGKGKVHPSPSPSGTTHLYHHPATTDHHVAAILCSLPATMITLTAALPPEDRQVLAYLISTTWKFSAENNNNNNTNTKEMKKKNSNNNKKKEHPPLFNCNCFRCYMSFWVRWDSSPNRHLIHEVLDAFENSLDSGMIPKNRRRSSVDQRHGSGRRDDHDRDREMGHHVDQVMINSSSSPKEEMVLLEETESGEDYSHHDGDDHENIEVLEKGSVRRFVNFLGERIWGVWN